jgi:RNA polymerase sigma factor (sigma-70 family)
MPPMDDDTLLRRFASEGAQDAFAELVGRHIDGVYSAALRRVGGDTHLAEDVAQQVFVALARKATSLSCHPVLTGWLYLTTRNEAANVVRTEQRRKAREQEAQVMYEPSADDASPPDWSRLAPLLDDAVDELNEHDRTAVLLRFVDRRGFAEIGATLRLTEDAARMRVDRALEKLRTTLARRGVTSTSAALGAILANNAVAAAPVGLGTAVTASALASAPLVATPVAGLLQFMGTSKIVSGGAAIALALAVPTAVYEVYTSHAEQRAAETARQTNEALAAQLRALKGRADAGEQAATALQRSSESALLGTDDRKRQEFEANARKLDKITVEARRDARFAEGNAFMARHPEARQAYLESRRAAYAGKFMPLFKSLQLSPVQIEQFKDLAVQQEDTGGIEGYWYRFGNVAEAREQMRTLLGDEGYRQYREFTDTRASAPWQNTVEIGGALFDTPTPLTAMQAEQLRRILTDNRSAPSWTKELQYDWSAIIPQVKEVLSEGQVAMLERYRAQDELAQAMARARTEWPRASVGGSTRSGK